MGGVTAAVLAIDGGNSKTDVCLISADGRAAWLRARARVHHQLVGPDAAFDVLAGLVAEAGSEAGIDTGTILAQHAAVILRAPTSQEK